ncbi:uncharacterized protein LOC144435396 [Glandiceps talaboti]
MTFLDAVWRDYPPYTSYDSDGGRLDGIVLGVIQSMLTKCCYGEISINYTTRVDNAVDMEIMYNENEEFSIAVPVTYPVTEYFKALNNGNSSIFLPVLESPGSVLVMPLNSSKQVGADLVQIIFEGWPLLLIIFISAGIAGIVMWLLDRWRNPIEFPRPFIRGFWEGFWWAFVTMTTVGYGDRSPRSIQARLFGIMWIIVGIAILSVFTAIVTTEMMAESSFVLQYNMEGMTLAVLNGTEQHRLVVDSGAEVYLFNSHEQMYQEVSSDNYDGFVLDQYSASVQTDVINKYGLGVAKFLNNPMHHGILVKNMNGNDIDCFREYLFLHRNQIFDKLKNDLHSIKPFSFVMLVGPEPLFHNQTITLILYTMAGWVCIVLIGIIWEFVYWRPMHRRKGKKEKKKKKVEFQENDKTINETQEELSTISENMTKKQQRRVINGQVNTAYVDYISPEYGDRECKVADDAHNGVMTERRVLMVARTRSKGISGLEGLIMRQNSELLCMEEEIVNFRQNWEIKVNAMQDRHKREQLEYLHSIKYGEMQPPY